MCEHVCEYVCVCEHVCVCVCVSMCVCMYEHVGECVHMSTFNNCIHLTNYE